MPELPEVETVVAALRNALVGRKLRGARRIGAVRLPFDEADAAKKLKNRTVTNVRRRAKYIVVDLDDGAFLLAHLGMTGYFHIDLSKTPPEKHDRLVFPLDSGEELRYADARRFGFAVPAEAGDDGWPRPLAGLGVEPLDKQCSSAFMHRLAEGRKRPVKNFIMSQEIVVGVGNIYASEALFDARVDPRRAAGTLSRDEWARLVKAIRAVLRRAIRDGGSTIRNYRRVDGTEGGFQRALSVYGKAGEPCPVCARPIEQVRLGGRSSFFCGHCQK